MMSKSPTFLLRNRDDSCEAEEIHNGTGSKGIAKDAKAQFEIETVQTKEQRQEAYCLSAQRTSLSRVSAGSLP
jgi:hypothetical protein